MSLVGQEFRGKIIRWNDEKGFGFIQCNDLPNEIFFHIREYRARNQRPSEGEGVVFLYGIGKNNKPQATSVRQAAFVMQQQHRRRKYEKRQAEFKAGQLQSLALAVVAYALLIALAFVGILPFKVVLWYAVLGVLTFGAYWKDKAAAQNGAWRTPESTLHILALTGGWIGAMLAHTYLRHKSQKQEFRMFYYITVVVNIALLVYLIKNRFLGLLT